jgi:protein-tyrosine phosphatase
MDGARASSGAAEAARENGIDIAGHRSRLLTPEIVDESDLILVMEVAHLYETQRVAPRAKGKTFLLSQYGRPGLSEDGGELDVADPLGGARDRYRECFDEIRGHLERAMPAIEDLAGRKRPGAGGAAGGEP